jgi:MoxR-like ATPase
MLREWAPEVADADLARFSLAELQELQREVVNVDVEPVRSRLSVIAGSALLAARQTATTEDLGVLAYLWTKAGDDDTIRRVLGDHDVPVVASLRHKREASAIELELAQLLAAGTDGGREEGRERVTRLFRLSREVQRDQQGDSQLQERVRQAYLQALEDLRAHPEEGSGHHV